MHPKFADWYRLVELVPNEDRLNKRWAGVEKLIANIAPPETLELVRVFYSRPPQNATFLGNFRGPFKEADASFPMDGNSLELSVLAGATIAQLLALKNRPLDLVAALGMTCADYRGHRRTELPPDFLSLAKQYLMDASAALRSNLTIVQPKLKAITEVSVAADLTTLQQGLTTLIAETRDFRSGTATALVRLGERQRLLAEELNIFWWVFGGYSRDLDRPFKDIPRKAVPLLAGKELADLIEVLPGPASSQAILARAIPGNDDGARTRVSVLQAVRSVGSDWIGRWTGRPGISLCGDICVTLLAGQRSLETPGSDDWTASVDNLTGVSVRLPLEPIALASQTYDEHRLRQALGMSP